MKAFIEMGMGNRTTHYQAVEINIDLAPTVAAGDVIFDENGAYYVGHVFHFPDRSVP